MSDTDGGLEGALVQTESDAAAALKAAGALVKELKRLHKLAQTGAVRDLEKSAVLVEQLAAATRDAVSAARTGWRFDTQAHLESGAFTAKLLARAETAGVLVQEQEGRIVSYPSIVRILPADDAVEIDRKRLRELRPSRVIERLRVGQTRAARFNAQVFLEALLRGYRLALAGRESGELLRLRDVYRSLTILPGQSAAYSLPEFVRDICLLDETRTAETKEGLKLSLDSASGGRTANAVRAVTREGEVRTYYGIAFRR